MVNDILVHADANVLATPIVVGISAGLLSLTGTLSVAIVTHAISATIAGATFKVRNDVLVEAISDANLVVAAAGATVGVIAAGVSIGIAQLNPMVTASATLSGASSALDDVTVIARHRHTGSAAAAGFGATTIVAAGAAGAIAAVGAVSFGEAKGVTERDPDRHRREREPGHGRGRQRPGARVQHRQRRQRRGGRRPDRHRRELRLRDGRPPTRTPRSACGT